MTDRPEDFVRRELDGLPPPKRPNGSDGEPLVPPSSEDDDGLACEGELHTTRAGGIKDTLHNAAVILEREPAFQNRLRWNTLAEGPEGCGLPWRRDASWAAWTELDDLELARWCQERGASMRVETCARAMLLVAHRDPHHPVQAFLTGLVWDRKPRLGSWLTRYLGVTTSPYATAVGRAWMVSAVARAFQPGCKADHGLILQGGQGVGKSRAAATIAKNDAWFADEIADLGSKDSAQDLRGKWLIELGELSAMRRGEVERIKAFMSRRVDHYRPSYGRYSQDFPRKCVFIGSTNESEYLKDDTGNRRFWPVTVGRIDIDLLRRDIDQLWAEATATYRAGEKWWLTGDVEQAAQEEQDARREADPWESAVARFLVGKVLVTSSEVLSAAIGMDLARQDQAAQKRISGVLRRLGWSRTLRRIGEKPTRAFVAPGHNEPS